MLSDELHSASETIWEGIQHYSYSQEYKNELIEILTKINTLLAKLDSPHPKNCIVKEQDIKNFALKRWSSRNCGEEFWNKEEEEAYYADAESQV